MAAIEKIRASNADFQDAFETYVQQYGKEKINFRNDTVNLANAIDPIELVFGSNCVIMYNDSSKMLKGSRGTLALKPDEIYILGRRQPQDAKLVIWGSHGSGGGIELEEYNSRVDTIPSRVHAVIAYLSETEILLTDLGSSAGTIVIGETPSKGPFVRIYDPGASQHPSIGFERIFMS